MISAVMAVATGPTASGSMHGQLEIISLGVAYHPATFCACESQQPHNLLKVPQGFYVKVSAPRRRGYLGLILSFIPTLPTIKVIRHAVCHRLDRILPVCRTESYSGRRCRRLALAGIYLFGCGV